MQRIQEVLFGIRESKYKKKSSHQILKNNSTSEAPDTFNALEFLNELEEYKMSEVGPANSLVSHADRNLKTDSVNKSSKGILQDPEITSQHVPNQLSYKFIFDANSRVYGGRFTQNGKLYYCSSQDIIGIYDAYDPYDMKKIKTVKALDVNWTITSMDTTEDEERLVYSSATPYLHILDLQTLCKFHAKIDLSDSQEEAEMSYLNYAGVFNCKFSGDGSEIVCVTNTAKIIVYDLNKEEKVCNIPNTHLDDINTVCFANRNNSNILFTGSDDYIIKAWDRRIIESNKPIGCFIGHREGVTSIDSRGDERYVASNGKDQQLKLWDIRKMNDISDLKKATGLGAMENFDYRWMDYTYKPLDRHKLDNSVMTFRGHTILQTLIRCYFSPQENTGQRYIYSGSADGCVYIFDIMTGENKTYISNETANCIRDVSWHPKVPVIAATSFSGDISVFTEDDSKPLPKRNCRRKCREISGYYGTSREFSSEEEEFDEQNEVLSELYSESLYS
ncbi:unnamed protein product [Moneuplotes crassus]|uniref:Uncharacterized protein n=1 Tax=Euplotes crassus TaxID=5936 RepID=A0AAD1UBT4_EUPCR|nr:unnamed protein product [Moneuplotes crassus]